MTNHDIQLLAIGATIGVELMVLLQGCFQILDNRRDRKARLAAEEKLKAARERAAA
ncbi:hypothetical protein AB0E08_05045 [Streptomyces sp. NPDC048281]|uniref:hypothetical protein n=1 Tax=Streptomyces sp. NPDC048281 TaxID=3154715 RepID=UPI003429F0B1